MKKTLTIQDLLDTGAHFGHPTSKWDPKFLPYIATKKNGIHIINLEETIKCIEKADKEINKITNKGGNILFVGI